MTDSAEFSSVQADIVAAKSLRDALFILKLKLATFGGCDVAYEFAVRPNAYIRFDLVSMTTLSRRFTDLYPMTGGTNADPVVENIGTMTEPLFVDLEKLTRGKATRFYHHKFFTNLAESGRPGLAAYPFTNPNRIGYGVMTIFESRAQRNTAREPAYYINIAQAFHNSVTRHGQIARYFGIVPNEHFALDRMAQGQNAADVAMELGLTQRTIEKRLQSARTKLSARTTNEAIYKAAAYGILR